MGAVEPVWLRLLQVVGVAILGIAGLFVVVRFLEGRMIYFPARYPMGVWDPARLGVTARDVWFEAEDGVRLHAWRFPAAGVEDGAPAPVLLWMHGNAGNLTGRAPHAQELARQGLEVLVFDYRGYGRSEGSPDEEGIYADAAAAHRWLVGEGEVDPERIVLYGRSLGAAPAARLSTRVEHGGLILVSPFPSAASMGRRILPGLHLLARSRFPVARWVAERHTPLLVIHGQRDDIVPVELGRRVFEAAAEPKELVLLPGAGHNDILAAGGRRYLDAVAEFAHRVAGPGEAPAARPSAS